MLAAAIDVGQPFAGVAAVIAVQHRGDRVDPQRIDVEVLQPMQSAGDQEALNLAHSHFPFAVANQRRVRAA